MGITAGTVLECRAFFDAASNNPHDDITEFIVGTCIPVHVFFASNGLVGEIFVDKSVLGYEVAIFP